MQMPKQPQSIIVSSTQISYARNKTRQLEKQRNCTKDKHKPNGKGNKKNQNFIRKCWIFTRNEVEKVKNVKAKRLRL